MSKLICGCGYLGTRVAALWKQQGQHVYVLTRSREHAEQFAAQGLSPINGDVTEPETLKELENLEIDTVLYAIGLDRRAGKPMSEVYVDGLKHVLKRLPKSLSRFIYISSTGVYGGLDGEWMDEDSPCEPERENGKICLEAEDLLTSHPEFGSKSILLRLAGIYGPGRVPYRQQLINGEPIAVPGSGYLNLIHVEDAARVVLQAEAQAPLPRLYTVSDGNPPQRKDYYEEAAKLLEAPEPLFEAPPADSPVAQRARSNKRIRNVRLVEELNPEFQFPTYREGLQGILGR
ncbi:Nucleoside-diphosphate-sugar epimerase [Planctomycetales bacterium 10988]|nr:Nucleoside-diphosphate-sugar epimerase [Planctomycetales bacterium 10988]